MGRNRISEEERIETLNINFLKSGAVIKRKGWKTFEGMVYQLKLINKRLLKQGQGELDFTVRLPLKHLKKQRKCLKEKEHQDKISKEIERVFRERMFNEKA